MCLRVYRYINVYTRVYVYMYMSVYTCMHMYVCVSIYIYIYMYMYIRTVLAHIQCLASELLLLVVDIYYRVMNKTSIPAVLEFTI